MKVFVIGATGYIGGSVARRLIDAGHRVSGLARTDDAASKLAAQNIEAVSGSLLSFETLQEAARAADCVINAANADDPFVVEAILPALEDTGKSFIQTSGSSAIADRAAGAYAGKIFHEDTPSEPLPERAGRVAIDRYVLSFAQRGVRTVVIRPSLIYGDGLGAKRDSIQVPRMEALARDKGVPLHIGEGLNIWSNVHIEDVCDLYRLAIENAPAGSLFYAENGEASMRDLAQWIGQRMGNGGRAESWPMEEALATWGISALASFASNSRVRADKARAMLKWHPSRPSLRSVVEAGS